MPDLQSLRVRIFADGADLASIAQMSAKPYISGFTTNPTLMRKAGVSDYVSFARQVLNVIKDKPVSFEVLADDFALMERQALEISSWGKNVFVKIPVTDTRGESSAPVIRRLARLRVKQNVTAVMTLAQVREVSNALGSAAESFISLFAGRVADTGCDPVPIMCSAVEMIHDYPNQKLIWASPREVLNIFQADAIGCHTITVTSDLLKKLDLIGKDLNAYSLETVQMFNEDAIRAGYKIPAKGRAAA
jgi:transaldolase